MFGAARLTDEVVRMAAEESPAALTRVCEALEPQVRLMVIGRLSPGRFQLDAVDELAQDAMLAVANGISQLEKRTVDGLKAWLSGIVRRKVAQHLKQRGKDRRGQPLRSLDSTVEFLSGAGPLWQLVPGSGTSPRSAAERAELVEAVFRGLEKLPPKYREAITLAFFDQLGPSEIAREKGVTREAVSMLVTRALRALRRELTGSSRF